MATAASDNAILMAALDYAARGWRVLPLREGKIPRPRAWQRAATTDEETIERWWQENPGDNLGVALGEASGIIDIECDSPEEEQALVELFGGVDKIPVTPTFASRRGRHRLFKWTADLPNQNDAVWKWGPLAFRTGGGNKGAQSAFPPSVHPSGVAYRWLITPDEADPAEIPQAVISRLAVGYSDATAKLSSAKPPEFWDRIAAGVGEGERNRSATQYIGIMLADLADPFNAGAIQRVWANVQRWNSLNSPPLEDRELATTFRSIMQKHQHAAAGKGKLVEKISEAVVFDPEQPVIPEWKLQIVESNPRSYRLWSPLWSMKAPQGFIELDAKQMRSGMSIAEQALEQADSWVPRTFDKLWHGDKDNESLARKLIATAEYIPAPLESKRPLVIAVTVLSRIGQPKRLSEEADIPDTPSLLSDGRITFKFDWLWRPMSRSEDQIGRRELLDVLEAVDIRSRAVRTRSSVKRLMIASATSLEKLREMTQEDPPEA